MLGAVSALSDDESSPLQAPGPKPKLRRSSLLRPPRERVMKAAGATCDPNDNPKRLANLIRGVCGCKADCFAAFRNHRHRLDEWLKLRKLMGKMTKLEKDAHVGVLHPFFWIAHPPYIQ